MALIIWIALLTVVTLISVNAAEPPLFRYGVYRECGGVVPTSTVYSTTIFYKEGQAFLTNEFCLWTLRSHSNVESVRIQVTPEISDSDSYALIAYFWDGIDLTSYRLTSNNTNSTFHPPPAFIALTTLPTTTTAGIHLVITPTGQDSEPLKGRAYHFDAASGEFSYPEKGNPLKEYRNNDRVSIVIPTRTFENGGTMKETKLMAVDVEAGYDTISVYELYYYWDPVYLGLLGRYSGKDEISFVTQYGHPIIILFTSDEKATGKGFTVQWGIFTSKQDL